MIYIGAPNERCLLECKNIPEAIKELNERYGWEVSEKDFKLILSSKAVCAPFVADENKSNMITKLYVYVLNILDFISNVVESTNNKDSKNYKHFQECLKDFI